MFFSPNLAMLSYVRDSTWRTIIYYFTVTDSKYRVLWSSISEVAVKCHWQFAGKRKVANPGTIQILFQPVPDYAVERRSRDWVPSAPEAGRGVQSRLIMHYGRVMPPRPRTLISTAGWQRSNSVFGIGPVGPLARSSCKSLSYHDRQPSGHIAPFPAILPLPLVPPGCGQSAVRQCSTSGFIEHIALSLSAADISIVSTLTLYTHLESSNHS